MHHAIFITAVLSSFIGISIVNHWRAEDAKEHVSEVVTRAAPPPSPPPPPPPVVIVDPVGFADNSFHSLLATMLTVGTVEADNINLHSSEANSVQLRTFMETFEEDIELVCGTPCVHGMRKVLTSCDCQCDSHWYGTLCETHDCFNRGVYDPSMETCVCTEATPYAPSTYCEALLCGVSQTVYFGSSCPPDLLLPDTDLSVEICHDRGQLVDNVCECTVPGATGLQCETVCASTDMNVGVCPLRANWGHDLSPEAYNTSYGVCGGGYTRNPAEMRIMYLHCDSPGSECINNWDAESARCCSPDVNCDTPGLCTPTGIDCCAKHTTEHGCRDHGCAWCDIPGLCAPADYAVNCTEPRVTPTAGDWRAFYFACHAFSHLDTQSACNPAARSTYLSVYTPECTSDACLEARRTEINDLPWPQLQPLGYTTTGRVHLVLAEPLATVFRPRGCRIDEPLVLEITDINDVGGAAHWTCKPGSAAQLVLAHPTADYDFSAYQQDGGGAYFVISVRGSSYYCLQGDSLPSHIDAMQIIGSDSDQALRTAVFVSTTIGSPNEMCTAFRFDEIAVGLQTYDEEYALTAIASAKNKYSVPAGWAVLGGRVSVDSIYK